MLHCTINEPVVFLMGPTATGKSDLALKLHDRLPVDIISVDSAMVYRGLNIGSAKPAPAVLAQVPHALIDIVDPADAYSVGRFAEDALREIERTRAAGRIPLLVGGTMLYFRALSDGLADLPESDPDVRARLVNQAAEIGWQKMYEHLSEVDPLSAKRIHSNDSQRILRALEVRVQVGRPLSALLAEQNRPLLSGKILKLVLTPPPRELLTERISKRFEEMLAHGLVEEVRELCKRKDLDLSLPAMRAVGYRQIGEYLAGQMSLAKATERAIIATRQLAKRQMTWLRNEADLHWLDCEQSDLVAQASHWIESKE